MLDHYEVFRLMDTWLRQELVPSLPVAVHLLLVGREAPVTGWFWLPSRLQEHPPWDLEPDKEALLLLEDLGLRRGLRRPGSIGSRAVIRWRSPWPRPASRSTRCSSSRRRRASR